MGLAKADPTNQVSESGVAADRIEVGMGFEELQDIRLFLVGLLEPVEGLFVVAETEVSIHKRTRGNVACLAASFQFREEPQCIAAPTGVGVGSDQDAGCCRTAMGKRDCLFQYGDCVCRLIVGDQRKSQVQ